MRFNAPSLQPEQRAIHRTAKVPFRHRALVVYDPVFNEQIKEWARRLAGKYKAGY
jgi:hypothetical protein